MLDARPWGHGPHAPGAAPRASGDSPGAAGLRSVAGAAGAGDESSDAVRRSEKASGAMSSINVARHPPGDAEDAASVAMLVAAGVVARNPLALAHFANHPAAGVPPNVLPCPYDLELAAPDHAESEDRQREGASASAATFAAAAAVRPSVPNAPFSGDKGNWVSRLVEPPSAASRRVHGLVLVACRPLEDEELFLNYRLNPEHPCPDWYQHVDIEEDRRRWG